VYYIIAQEHLKYNFLFIYWTHRASKFYKWSFFGIYQVSHSILQVVTLEKVHQLDRLPGICVYYLWIRLTCLRTLRPRLSLWCLAPLAAKLYCQSNRVLPQIWQLIHLHTPIWIISNVQYSIAWSVIEVWLQLWTKRQFYLFQIKICTLPYILILRNYSTNHWFFVLGTQKTPQREWFHWFLQIWICTMLNWTVTYY